MVDAGRRGVEIYWYFIIFFVPFGGVVYFVIYKAGDFWSPFSRVFDRPPSLEETRFRYENTPSLENHLALANSLHGSKQFEEAINHYKQILDREPEDTDALFGLGQSLCELGRYSEAVQPLEKVVQIRPGLGDYKAWPILARARWEKGEREQAIEILRKLTKSNPRIDFQLLFSQYLVEMGKYSEAKGLVEASLRDHRHAPKYVRQSYVSAATAMRRLRKQLG